MLKDNIEIIYNENLNKELDYSPLKLHFWIMDNIVVLKVLEQDIRLCVEDKWFEAKDDEKTFKFNSYDFPELDAYNIYFRGQEHIYDNITCCISLKDSLMAKEYVKFIKKVFNIVDFMQTEILVDIFNPDENLFVPVDDLK